jgi:hypothetical protein
MGEIRNACSILVEEPDGKRQLGRPSSRCEDETNLEETWCEGVSWIHLA